MSFKVADAFVEVATRVAAGTNAKMAAEGAEAGRAFNDGFDKTQDSDKSRFNKLGQNLRDLKEIWSSSIGKISDFGKAIAGAAIKAGALSTAIVGGVGLSGGLVTFVTNLSVVTGALPVFALAMGQAKVVALGFQVALSGVGSALKDAVGDAFTKVSPQAQHFVDTFKSVVPELVKARNAIQDAAFKGLADDIKPLAQTYLPMLTRAGQDVARTFNGAVRDALFTLKGNAAKTNVQVILNGIHTSVSNLVPQLSKIPALLLKAGAQATPALNGITKQLGGLIQTATTLFSNYLASGKLTGDIKGAFSVLSSLGHTILSVFGTVSGVARAAHAAFGDVISPIQAVTSKLSQYVNSAGGQAKITQMFRDAKPVLAEIANTFSILAKNVAPLWPVVLKLADAFLKGLQPVIPVIAQLAGQVGGILADVLPAVSQLAVALGKSLGGALKTLAPVVKPVADALTNLLGPTGAFQAFLKAIAPILPPLADALGKIASIIGDALAKAFEEMAPVLPGLVDALTHLAVDAVGALAPILPDVVQAFVDLVPVIEPLIKIADLFALGLGKIIGWMGPLAPAIIAVTVAVWALNAALAVNPFVAIGIALVVLVGLVVKYWDQITHAIGVALEAIKTAITTAWDWIYQHTIGWLVNMAKAIGGAVSGWVSAIGTGVANAAKTVGSLGAKAASAAVNFGSALISRGGDLIRGLGHGISTAWNDVVAWVKSIPGKILGAIGNLGSLLWNAGKSLISGFFDGIKSAWSGAVGFFSSITSSIPSLKGPPEKDSKLLVDNGRRIMSGLITGIDSQRSALADILRDVTGDISGFGSGASVAPRGVGSVAGAGGFHVDNLSVTIPAKDIAEMKSVTEFFNRVQQEARRQAPRMARA